MFVLFPGHNKKKEAVALECQEMDYAKLLGTSFAVSNNMMQTCLHQNLIAELLFILFSVCFVNFRLGGDEEESEGVVLIHVNLIV